MKATYFLIAIAIVMIFFMVELFNPFLKAISVSILLAVATNSLTHLLEKKLKSKIIASSIMTIGLASIFFVPILYCIFSFVNFFNYVNQESLINILDGMKTYVQNFSTDLIDLSYIKKLVNDVITKIDVGKIAENIFSLGAYLGKNSAKFMMDIIMILIFFFFFTLYSSSIVIFIKNLLPIKREDSIVLFYESSNVMTVVLYSILVTAIFEGFLFGFFLTFFGYDGLLCGVLYGFASLIPVVGGVIMWLPIIIYEATTSVTNAIIIAVYSILMISVIADTFIKPMIIKYINKKVVKTPTTINELLIFFSIVAGLSTFGFWGMIIGPAMVTFFISIMLLLKKYSEDFKDNVS